MASGPAAVTIRAISSAVGVSNGAHSITVKRIGYLSISQNVTVTEGGQATADFSLDKSALKLDAVSLTFFD